MARKPGKKKKENMVGCTEEGKRWKGNKRRVQRKYDGKRLYFSLGVRWPLWVMYKLCWDIDLGPILMPRILRRSETCFKQIITLFNISLDKIDLFNFWIVGSLIFKRALHVLKSISVKLIAYVLQYLFLATFYHSWEFL